MSFPFLKWVDIYGDTSHSRPEEQENLPVIGATFWKLLGDM